VEKVVKRGGDRSRICPDCSGRGRSQRSKKREKLPATLTEGVKGVRAFKGGRRKVSGPIREPSGILHRG